MNHLPKVLVSLVLAVQMTAMIPAQVFADAPDYIADVKVFMGSYDDASSEGYTVLKDGNGKALDLNQGAGSTSIGAKGNKAVYLGYKTTKNSKEAVTDLALMNMKGGYDIKEYELIMKKQMKEQIIPRIIKSSSFYSSSPRTMVCCKGCCGSVNSPTA